MKEIIYLDTKLVNSCLAQIDEGILTKLISGYDSSESSQEDGGEEITNSTSGGVEALFVNGGHNYSKTDIDKFSTVYSKSNSELIETALDDYSLDVLLDKLEQKQLLESNNWSDGEIVSFEGATAFYNFEQLLSVTNEETIRKVVPKSEEVIELENQIKKLEKQKNKSPNIIGKINNLKDTLIKEDGIENFKNVERFASFMSILFPDTLLTKTNNTFTLCAKKNIRVNVPTLSLYTLTKQHFKILGIVISKYEKSIVPKDGEQLESDYIVSATPTIFMDIMLDSFNMLKFGDYFVRPIAIYSERE